MMDEKKRKRRSSSPSISPSSESSIDDSIGHFDACDNDVIRDRCKYDDDALGVHFLTIQFSSTDKILRMMGIGTFGKVFECEDSKHGDTIALKVVRKIPKYIESAEIEADILGDIYALQKQRKKSLRCCVKLYSQFKLDGHFFMVFEPLGKSIYDVIRKNDYSGFPLSHVRSIARLSSCWIGF
jgi:hypothetical protein